LEEAVVEYRRLGRSGLNVSKIVLGTMNLGGPTEKTESLRIIDQAVDGGINLFDCADVYAGGESEKVLGDALGGGRKRSGVLILTKVYMRTGDGPNDAGNSKHRILASCESSLKRLGTDYIDIYMLHRTDFNVPQEETLAALDLLVSQGKIRYIGCSTHPPWRTVEAVWISEKHHWPKFVCEEPPYNLLDRRIENDIVPMCRAYDLGILTWSPLAQGVLANRYEEADRLPPQSRGTQKSLYAERITQKGIEVGRELSKRAEAKGCTTAQLAVAWVLCQPGITAAIVGPRTVEHLEELLASAELVLEHDDFSLCDTLVPPGTFVSDHFNTSGWRPMDEANG
jgi:aryl-alcohol dehydrogenase-like predicted oxidoreductase